jgi:thiamine kinase-like enzyme
VLEAVDQVPWSAEWMDRELFRARVANCGEESDKHLLVGTGHGDLSCGNILITEDKRVCLLDWSRSREQILMQDLEKLFQQFPGSWTLAVDRMGSWRPEEIDPDRIMSCSHQAMLGNLQQIQSFSEIRQKIAALDTAWMRQMVQQCDRSLIKEFAAATRLMSDGRL